MVGSSKSRSTRLLREQKRSANAGYLAREHGISEATLYDRRTQYGSMTEIPTHLIQAAKLSPTWEPPQPAWGTTE